MAPNSAKEAVPPLQSGQDGSREREIPLSGGGGGGGGGGAEKRYPPESADYYARGSADAATEDAITLAKIQHRIRLTKTSNRLVIVLVGLPGRGKSFIARKLQNFLTWRGSECRVFNVGKYRRQAAAGACDANFFDSKNEAAAAMRQEAASLALEDMLGWIDGDGDSGATTPTTASAGISRKDRVGIFDATNSTHERRAWVLDKCTCRKKRAGKPTGVVFVESICDDKDLLHANFMTKVTGSPDYRGMDVEEAMADLRSRVEKYEEAYETIEDETQSYIKIYNLSSKILVNHIYGRVAKSILPSLMAWNIGTRPVFVCRAGQTMNESERASLNCGMSRSENLGKHGLEFSNALFHYIKLECLDFIRKRQKAAFSPDLNTGTSISGSLNRGFGSHHDLTSMVNETASHDEEDYVGEDGVTPLPFPCKIMSSTMPRAIQTVEWNDMPYPVEILSNLNPLDKGDFTGQELEDLALSHPEWYERLVADPFYTRFPGGECYGDLTSRLESVVVDIEQQVGPVLVVSHISVLQVLVAYFRNVPVEGCTSAALPMNTVLKFTPAKGGGWHESRHRVLDSPDDSTRSLSTRGSNAAFLETPVLGQQVSFANRPNGDGSCPTEAISPLPALPIWGDHARRSGPAPQIPGANIV